jgi:hypothetical protein
MMLAALQQNSGNFPLFIHVAGAMILVGGLVTAAGAGILGWRDTAVGLRRFSALTLFAVALPGWLIMRGGAEWIYSNEHWDKAPDKPTWLDIGLTTADVGGIVLLVALVLGGIGVRQGRSSGGGTALLRASTVLAAVLVVAYVVAVWAMGGKPS